MNKILIIIVAVGLLLRVLFINSSPLSLYGDELTIALDANALLKTGTDQLGNFLPLTFEMGAGRPAGYVYTSIPFLALFGPTPLGVRGLSILSGLGIIYLMYLLGKRLFSKKIGLLAAGIAALSPWEISLSRGGFEAHFALFLAFLGAYLFLKGKDNSKFYILSALSFGLTLHTYPTYKVTLIFFLPLLFWYAGIKNISSGIKSFTIGALVFIFLGILALSQTFIGGSETRFSEINIFSQSGVKNTIEQKINTERRITALPDAFDKYFHNKPIEYTKVFIENYLQNFSLDFLVLHGDKSPRHNMGTMGQLYFLEIILIAIGIISFWLKERRTILFILLWIGFAPIATALIDFPHALRSSFMLPPFLILSSLGLIKILSIKNKAFIFLISGVFLIQFIFFIQKIYFLSPSEYSSFWSYSAKQAADLSIENKKNYQYIFLSDKINDIEYAYPFYANIRSEEIISQNKKKTLINGREFKKFSNIYIGYIPDGEIEPFINGVGGSVLYIGPYHIKDALSDYEIIVGKDGTATLAVKKISN